MLNLVIISRSHSRYVISFILIPRSCLCDQGPCFNCQKKSLLLFHLQMYQLYKHCWSLQLLVLIRKPHIVKQFLNMRDFFYCWTQANQCKARFKVILCFPRAFLTLSPCTHTAVVPTLAKFFYYARRVRQFYITHSFVLVFSWC